MLDCKPGMEHWFEGTGETSSRVCRYCGKTVAEVDIQPIVHQPEEHIPEIDGEDYSIGSLMVAISNGTLKLPVWIRYNRSRHLLRPENATGIVHGLLIALEDLTSDL